MRKLLILNLVLGAVVAAAAVRLYSDSMMFVATHQPGAIQPQREVLAKAVSVVPSMPAAGEWTDIPQHNPFSFDRNDSTVVDAPPPPPPPGPKPILFGTLVLGKERTAMVAQGKSGNRNYRPMKVGEMVDGWTIAEILDKSIVVRASSLEATITMNDPTAEVQRDYSRSQPAPGPPQTAAPAPVVAFPIPTPTTSAPLGQTPRRRVLQQTPFGIREIEEP